MLGAVTFGHTYRWWVRGVATSGAASAWSSASDFTLTLLPTPVLVGPSGGIVTPTTTFTWHPVAGATQGNFGSFFRTSVQLTGSDTTPTTGKLVFHPARNVAGRTG